LDCDDSFSCDTSSEESDKSSICLFDTEVFVESQTKAKLSKTTETTDIVMELISQQSFNGNFAWGEALKVALKEDSQEKILARSPRKVSLENWLTILVITYLKLKKPDEKDLWELVVQKAKSFLEKEEPNVEKRRRLEKAAEEYIVNL